MSSAIRKGADRARQLARSGRFKNSFEVQAALSAEEAQCMSEAFFRSDINRLCDEARTGSDDN
jgi:hypothetical protein